MDTTLQLIAIGVILLTFVLSALQGVLTRRGNLPMRRIAAFESLSTLANESIEANRPLHLSLGSATIGGGDTMLALAGAQFMYYATLELTYGDTPPLFTLTEASSVPIAIDTMRRAYQTRDRLEGLNLLNIRWYPAGARSLAFAAGIVSLQGEENVSANVLIGSFGLESALIVAASKRRNRPVLVGTDQLEGQAVAFAMADYVLIGEEIFAAPGYLDANRKLAGRNIVTDLLRWGLVAVIVLLTVFSLLTGA